MQPRYYQIAACEAAYDCFKHNKDAAPLIVMPTGTGKSLVLAMLADHVANVRCGRTCILAHRKELVEQNAAKVTGCSVGMYSASLGRRDYNARCVVAQIQSAYKRATEFGKFDLIIVDEAHMVSPDDATMFTTFINDARMVNPRVRLLGLTATPYRMREGCLIASDTPWTEVCYEYEIGQAIKDGYLCPLVSKPSKDHSVSTDGLKIVRGEFVTSEIEGLVAEHVIESCQEIVALTQERHSVLVFCVSRKHARQVAELLGGELVLGDMTATERDAAIERFRNGETKFLVNVDCLTTGFDVPRVDAIAMLRPTASRGLYVQIAGRGTRLHDSKRDCLFLDFGGNVRRHGPIDVPWKLEAKVWTKKSNSLESATATHWECPECGFVNDRSDAVCGSCNFERERAIKHAGQADDAAIMQAAGVQPVVLPEWEDVLRENHFVHRSKKSGIDLMCVEYDVGDEWPVREFVCIEHDGFAYDQAKRWWAKRSNDAIPDNAEDAVAAAKFGGLAKTHAILVDRSEKYPRIKDHRLGVPPAPVIVESLDDWIRDEDIPF